MKALILAGACALALVLFSAGDALAQCRGGGGGGGGSQAATMTASTGTTASSGSAQLLTGPGSWAHDVMAAQMVHAAYARQQAVVAAQKAAKQAERKAKAQAVARQRRASELYRRDRVREQSLLAANN
jgi:hypothetical protein